MKEIISKIPVRKLLQYALYIFLVLLIQDMVFPQIRILGVCPMVLPAAAVALGMFGGPQWGTAFALVMGIFADMSFTENTVLFTIMMPAIAFGVNFLAQFFLTTKFPAYAVASVAAMLLTGAVQMVHVLLYDGYSSGMLTTVVLQTAWALPVAALAYFPLAKWFK